MAHISQREARRLRAENSRLRHQIKFEHSSFVRTYPGGVNICTLTWGEPSMAAQAMLTAANLGHPVVAVPDNNRSVRVYALPIPVEPKDEAA